jgi:flagellum-specific ATP synthase
MGNVSPREQVELARRARGVLARVGKARDLIQLGAYQAGHDAELDQALQLHPQLLALLQQDMHDRAPLAQSRAQLARLMTA